MTISLTQIPTDTWVTATWSDYLQTADSLDCATAKTYYYKGRFRLEMSPVTNEHASDHSIIIFAVCLYASLKGIILNGKDNCTYRHPQIQECQPDFSCYIGDNAQVIAWGTGIINLENFPPPDLVIEIARSSISDDKGEKRLLYEDLKVKEYWIVDVNTAQILAFTIDLQGSHRIRESQVLPSLNLSVLESALSQTRTSPQSQVCSWLLTQFQ
ncbi:Uma2 family endonuclease [Kamptonema animale CS-326]|jgi:Uma2 family endonuclease|uniref:Uma2 family endonuclease n=1 Tax=Kamptonema animale TaxID=92934 RepID=UPI00232F1779|nr:Uma2 family endonuclease [Kamptonema animale]MDB9513752.1 Uma2 family endonuclease [Kamptonema animale CS-326]